jgi:nucleotide-binding universal stress UspA family protein
MARIVVGYDGSHTAERALRWAVDEAHLRDAEIDLVIVTAHSSRFDAMTTSKSREELEEAAAHVLGQLLEEVVLEKVDTSGLTVHRSVRVGSAAEELCEAAVGADLLVIGARGHGGFKGLLLGSAAQQVVAHSPCPIVVVVPEDR